MTTVQPVNSRAECEAVRIPDGIELHGQPPGSFKFAHDGDTKEGLLHTCPCGCGQLRFVPFRLPGVERPSWVWDGNEDKPTLEPSLNMLQQDPETGATIGEHWHGFLRAGRWVMP